MHEEIIHYLRDNPQGISPEELAEKFFKLKNAGSVVARATISSILSKDKRCFQNSEGNWQVHAIRNTENMLDSAPFTAVYLLYDPHRKSERIYYLSLWDVLPTPRYLWGAWLTDIKTLPYEEQENVCSGPGQPYDPVESEKVPVCIARELESRLPVYLSSYESRLLRAVCARSGEYLTDDFYLISELFKAADIKIPRPLTLSGCLKATLGTDVSGPGVYNQGAQFAACVAESVKLLLTKGIETREGLEQCGAQDKTLYFTGKAFSYDDICALPSSPGVYGFKDTSGAVIYIGKAKNLKRRLMNYFRDSEESPHKLQLIRSQSHALLTYQCGSELESLLYEYRLIRKHTPALNKQTSIGERNGSYSPVDDCIVVLPHAQPGKVVTFWFRKNQKIQIRVLSTEFIADDALLGDLDDFFFNEKLPADSQDFPELEIASRWVKKYQDSLAIVPVSRMATAQEIFLGIGSYWRELQ